jgi:hypothetical protein
MGNHKEQQSRLRQTLEKARLHQAYSKKKAVAHLLV